MPTARGGANDPTDSGQIKLIEALRPFIAPRELMALSDPWEILAPTAIKALTEPGELLDPREMMALKEPRELLDPREMMALKEPRERGVRFRRLNQSE